MSIPKKVVETLGVALIAVNAHRRIVLSNPAATRLFGYSSAQFAELDISDLIPDWGSEFREGQPLPPHGTTVLREVTGHHHDGTSIILEVQFEPWETEADGSGFTLVLRDIKAELAEERARRADVRLRSHAVLGARIGIFEVDFANQTSQVSGAWRGLMEMSYADDIEPQVEWLNRIHPEDRPLVLQSDRDCVTGKSLRSLVNYRLRSRDGMEWRWMQSDSVVAARDENGKATRLIGAQIDITESKKAEEALRLSERQFRSAMENATIGKALVALDGRWLTVNPALCKFLGYTEQELLEVDFQTITHPDDLKADVKHVEELLSGVERSYSMEKRYLRADGEIIWGDLSVALVRDENDTPLHFITEIVDITDRRRLERMKRDFIATVSHELRLPVTAIAAALDLIALGSSDALPERFRKLMSITHENARRLRLIVDDVLDLDRLTSDRMPINLVPSNIVEIVDYTIRATQPFLDKNNVVVERDYLDEPVFCNVDPARLEQVLTNLLSNAAKFSPDGGLVKVSFDFEEDQVRIAVSDNGIGIPANHQESIFQPFSQVAPKDKRSRMGTGLGLSISKQLIERMGGTIGVNSKTDEGSEFWIKLAVESVSLPNPAMQHSSG